VVGPEIPEGHVGRQIVARQGLGCHGAWPRRGAGADGREGDGGSGHSLLGT
jgi:hypothetical protein